MDEENAAGYEPYDGCYGTVTERCRAGAYLHLDNGEEAFAYNFGNLYPGTEVLCTVRKRPQEGKKTLVSIDSVVSYPDFKWHTTDLRLLEAARPAIV